MDAAIHALEHSAFYLQLLKLQAQAVVLYGQVAAWSAQVEWENLRPVLLVDGGVLVLCALLLFQPSRTQEEEQTFWTELALAGRWMVSGAGLIFAAFVTVSGTHLI